MNKYIINYLPFFQEFICKILKNGVDLRLAAIYGSIVTGELSPTSDIDMKIFVGNRKDIKTVKQIEKDINEKIIKTGFKNFIHSIISVKTDPEQLGEGILLFGKPLVLTAKKEEIKENTVITYDTTNIDKNKTAKLSMRLFGQKLKRKIGRKIKIYTKEGLVDMYGGKPLRNAILINSRDAEKIVKVLEEFGIPYKTAVVYTERLADFLER